MDNSNLWDFINSNTLIVYSILLTLTFIFTINRYNKLKSKITNLDSNLRSNAVRQGLTLEQWIPMSENYPWDHRNFRFLGDPIDGIQFEDEKILLVEFKSGNSRMSNKQKAIQQLVENGKVEFVEIKTN
jgi:predicted Holliday junction resolvase-like endonuclease|tara:strand:- start:1207 stop:1593 length:387 start_codon:yes stop_codon:yes gene_type:complete